jgi:ABC-type nitrate/sulfonate/bicarbonate transport system substrate-binding protein
MKKMFGLMLSAVMLIGLSGPISPVDADTLRIGAHRSLWGSMEVVADKMGYWKELGLKYKVGHYKQGKLMRNAIIQGNLDTGTTGFSPFVGAVSKGAKVQSIGVTANICGAISIMVLKKAKGTTLADFKGTFANKKGTSTDFAFQQYVLPAYGFKSSDFPLLSVRATERIAALITGNAKAAMVGEPQSTIAESAGKVRRLENLCKYDKTRMMHIGNPKTIKNKPELYVKYFKGWLKGQQLLKNNPDKYAEVYTQALQARGDKAKLKDMKKVVRKLKSEPFVTAEVKNYLNDMAAKQKKLGWIKKHPDFTNIPMVDDSILRKVAKGMNY